MVSPHTVLGVLTRGARRGTRSTHTGHPRGPWSTHTGRPRGTQSTGWMRRRAGRTGGKPHEAARPSRCSLSLGQLSGILRSLWASRLIRSECNRSGRLTTRSPRRTAPHLACVCGSGDLSAFIRTKERLPAAERGASGNACGPGGPKRTKRTNLTACGARGGGKEQPRFIRAAPRSAHCRSTDALSERRRWGSALAGLATESVAASPRRDVAPEPSWKVEQHSGNRGRPCDALGQNALLRLVPCPFRPGFDEQRAPA